MLLLPNLFKQQYLFQNKNQSGFFNLCDQLTSIINYLHSVQRPQIVVNDPHPGGSRTLAARQQWPLVTIFYWFWELQSLPWRF